MLVESVNGSAYLVGGALRDLLDGREPTDFDVAGSVAEPELVRRFAGELHASWFRLDNRQALYRVVRKMPGGGVISFDFTALKGPTIDRDLALRDFTVNAMALNLRRPDQGLIDPLGGAEDIKHRRLRLAGPDAIRDDPLRLLRAYRFAAQLGLDISATLQGVLHNVAGLKRVSGERIRDELFGLLQVSRSSAMIRRMAQDGAFFEVFPPAADMVGVTQNEYHHLDVWHHSLLTLELIEDRIVTCRDVPDEAESSVRDSLNEEPVPGRPLKAWLKLAALFHDLGKPRARFIDENGRVRFFRHEAYGAEMVPGVLERLAPSRKEVDWVQLAVRNHMRLGQLFTAPRVTPRAMSRLVQRAGNRFHAWFLLFLADYGATLGPASSGGDLSPFAPRIRELFRLNREKSAAEERPRLITGRDILSVFNVPPGPVYGKILKGVALGVLEGRITTRREALEEAGAFLEKTEKRRDPD